MSANTANSRARSRRGVAQQPPPNLQQNNSSGSESNKPINVVDFVKIIDLRLKRIEDNLPKTMTDFAERLAELESNIDRLPENNNLNVGSTSSNMEIENNLPGLEEILNEIATLQQQIRNVQTFAINTNNQFNRIVTKYKLLNPIEPNDTAIENEENITQTVETEISEGSELAQ